MRHCRAEPEIITQQTSRRLCRHQNMQLEIVSEDQTHYFVTHIGQDRIIPFRKCEVFFITERGPNEN